MEHHLETSSWKFESDYQITQKVGIYKVKALLQDRKQEKEEELNQYLETEMKNILQQEIEEMQVEENPILSQDETSMIEPSSFQLESSEENLESLKESEAEFNPYLVLLNRLDEEEGVRAPSIEDKLKLAEDRLRISTQKFCSTCEKLTNIEKDIDATNEYNTFHQPALVQGALQPKVLEPSHRPPRTLHVTKFEKKPMTGLDTETLNKEKKNVEKEDKSRAYFRQDFHLPPKSWFAQDKQETNVTQEEMELLNSTSTKAFLKFLSDRKKEPPKIIKDIQRRVMEMKTEKKKE